MKNKLEVLGEDSNNAYKKEKWNISLCNQSTCGKKIVILYIINSYKFLSIKV